MKKIVFILSVFAFLLTSCSGDDSSIQSNDVLVTKSKITFEDGSIFESTFQYDGNKITKIVYGPQRYTVVTYSGNLIVKTELFESGILNLENRYVYQNSKLVNFKSFEYDGDNGYTEDVDYVYNTDGTVGFTSHRGPLTQPASLTSTGVFNLNSFGEVTSIVYSGGQTQAFSYDDKNSPLKNILGMDKLAFEGTYPNEFLHNLTSEIDSYSNTTNTYTYNSGNYPLTAIEDDGSEEIQTQYFYNQ